MCVLSQSTSCLHISTGLHCQASQKRALSSFPKLHTGVYWPKDKRIPTTDSYYVLCYLLINCKKHLFKQLCAVKAKGMAELRRELPTIIYRMMLLLHQPQQPGPIMSTGRAAHMAARLAPYCSVVDRRMVWHSAALILRPIGTASRVKYGILLDDIKIMVSLTYSSRALLQIQFDPVL